MELKIKSYKKRNCYHRTLVKNMGNLGILAKIMVRPCTILQGHGVLAKIMVSPCTILQGHGILAKIMVSPCTILQGHGILAKIMVRSWQDLGKTSKELAMDLGKDTMASTTGFCHVISSTEDCSKYQK